MARPSPPGCLPHTRLLRPRNYQRRGAIGGHHTFLERMKKNKKMSIYSWSKRRAQSSVESNTYGHFPPLLIMLSASVGAIHALRQQEKNITSQAEEEEETKTKTKERWCPGAKQSSPSSQPKARARPHGKTSGR